MKFIISILLSIILITFFSVQVKAETETLVKEDVEASINKGLDWLSEQQEDNGSWSNYPGITGLVLSAYLSSPRNSNIENRADEEVINKGLEYLSSLVQEDGSIHNGEMPNYNTSVSLMAFSITNDIKYDTIIINAQNFLIGLQCIEETGYTPDNKFYGGIGYGGDDEPDLSNLQMALDALHTSELADTNKVWEKALVFLQRCQNRSESNDQAWAGNDGGFAYSPTESKAGEDEEGAYQSYGTMTYNGIRSYIYTQVDKEDPRVQDAMDWLSKNYTLEENPPLGNQGLYYYYNTFAKTFAAYGETLITDNKGIKHNWWEELGEKLLSLQTEEGYWINEHSRWWERDPNLVTAYVIIALMEGYNFAYVE